jgi:hypothetical protein
MRISEITDAQGQLELLRTIIDNTWTAIAQQAEQAKRVDAERRAQAKLKPRAKKASKGTSLRIPTPKPPPPKQPQAPLAKQSPPQVAKPNPNTLNGIKPQPPTNPQPKTLPPTTAVNPKLPTKPTLKSIAKTPINQQSGVKGGYIGKNIGTLEKEDDGDDRHSKNGIATLKK